MLASFPIYRLDWAISIQCINSCLFVTSRLLPPILFEKFIDVGHYVKDLDAYSSLVECFNNLPVCLHKIFSCLFLMPHFHGYWDILSSVTFINICYLLSWSSFTLISMKHINFYLVLSVFHLAFICRLLLLACFHSFFVISFRCSS